MCDPPERGTEPGTTHLNIALTDKSSEAFENCDETHKFITDNYQDLQSSFVCF